MQSKQTSFYHDSVNQSGLSQAAAVVRQPQNVIISTGSSLGGAATPGLPILHYPGRVGG